MASTDFLIAGAGVVGLSVARELRRRHPGARVVVLEKEPTIGLHASGRNSGVLHAGFYYTPDSLKARFTREGNARMQQFCGEHGLPLNRCGKLVVATSPEELVQLEALYARGLHNGVELRMVTAAEAHAIEPRARVFERAIHSPTTASVDPGAVMARLASCAVAEGVEVRCGEGFARLAGEAIHSTREVYSAGTFINAAGLHADAIAHAFGLGLRYRILPFRGRYLRSGEPPGRLHVHVYPVPDPQWPFLGVHCTVTVDGAMKLGPTAFPALWREQYGGLANFRLGEFAQVCKREIQLLVRSRFRFATLAWRELATASAAGMVAQATRLVDGLDPAGSWTPTRPGIRAQLIDLDTGRLENDFVIESDTRSVHVLNAVSPAFTCAFPFAEHVCDRIEHGPAAG